MKTLPTIKGTPGRPNQATPLVGMGQSSNLLGTARHMQVFLFTFARTKIQMAPQDWHGVEQFALIEITLAPSMKWVTMCFVHLM